MQFLYNAIRGRKRETYSLRYQEATERAKTEKYIKKAQKAIKRNTGKEASRKQIWKSTRNKALSTNVRQFLFKLIHGGFKVGKYWENIPGYEHRATCAHCHVPESIRHVRLECNATDREDIWRMVEETWKKNLLWPKLGLLTIVTSGLTTLETEGKIDAGASRFYHILMRELVWKLRNQRVINEEDPMSHPQIEKKWEYELHLRYKTELLTNKRRYEKQALPRGLVENTWHKIEEVDDPPDTGTAVGGTGV